MRGNVRDSGRHPSEAAIPGPGIYHFRVSRYFLGPEYSLQQRLTGAKGNGSVGMSLDSQCRGIR